MAQNISWLGANWTNVPWVTLPKTGGGTAKFIDPTPTTATDSDVTSGKVYFKADGTQSTGTGSGGGGTSNFTLLGTLAIGTISTSSTTAADTGKSLEVSGLNDYDLLVMHVYCTPTNGRHVSTTRVAWLTAGSALATKNGATLATATWNAKRSSNGTVTTRASTTTYGIYPYSISAPSSGKATITVYQRYNNTQTGTINGNYTMKVYGVKIYDLIS